MNHRLASMSFALTFLIFGLVSFTLNDPVSYLFFQGSKWILVSVALLFCIVFTLSAWFPQIIRTFEEWNDSPPASNVLRTIWQITIVLFIVAWSIEFIVGLFDFIAKLPVAVKNDQTTKLIVIIGMVWFSLIILSVFSERGLLGNFVRRVYSLIQLAKRFITQFIEDKWRYLYEIYTWTIRAFFLAFCLCLGFLIYRELSTNTQFTGNDWLAVLAIGLSLYAALRAVLLYFAIPSLKLSSPGHYPKTLGPAQAQKAPEGASAETKAVIQRNNYLRNFVVH